MLLRQDWDHRESPALPCTGGPSITHLLMYNQPHAPFPGEACCSSKPTTFVQRPLLTIAGFALL